MTQTNYDPCFQSKTKPRFRIRKRHPSAINYAYDIYDENGVRYLGSLFWYQNAKVLNLSNGLTRHLKAINLL